MTTANQRLKGSWSACLIGSTLVATAVHLVLVQVVPPWEFPLRELREQGATFVQLVSISSDNGSMDAKPDIHETVAPLVAVQPDILEPQEVREQLLPDGLPALTVGLASPTVPRLEPKPFSVRPSTGGSKLNEMVPPLAWP